MSRRALTLMVATLLTLLLAVAGALLPVPYVVLLVRLDDQSDILMPGSYEGPTDGQDLEVGLPVRVGFVDFDDGGEGFSLPTWSRAVEGTCA